MRPLRDDYTLDDPPARRVVLFLASLATPKFFTGGTLVILFLLLLHGTGCNVSFRWQYRLPPGITVPEPPLQINISGKGWNYEGNSYTALARYTIRARVIITGRHFSTLSPVDLTLGWGHASDTNVLKNYSFIHSYRHVFWNGRSNSVDPWYLSTHLANLHAIPANSSVRRDLLSLKLDDIVTLEGYLVYVEGESLVWGRWYWQSSLSRDDTGDGACEVMWVEKVKVEKR